MLRSALICLLLVSSANAAETSKNLLFKKGTLSHLSASEVLEYDQAVHASALPDKGERFAGKIILMHAGENEISITFHRDGKHRKFGKFPMDSGNPLLPYFLESVIRDMASIAGGSPFYIRNRVKAVMFADNPITPSTVTVTGQKIEASIIEVLPFATDPNRERMKGFETLVLTFILSEHLPGWYHSLEAIAKINDEVSYRRIVKAR